MLEGCALLEKMIWLTIVKVSFRDEFLDVIVQFGVF